jgi:hypothetical protein
LGGAAILLLIASAKEIDEFLEKVEWSTLLFFAGLFVSLIYLISFYMSVFFTREFFKEAQVRTDGQGVRPSLPLPDLERGRGVEREGVIIRLLIFSKNTSF